jgi:hypothetical protein
MPRVHLHTVLQCIVIITFRITRLHAKAYPIGFAQNEKEMENMVDKVVKKHSAVLETKAAVIISPEDIKEYTTEVLN